MENLKTYLNIDPKDMMTAVTVTSSQLLDQNSSEKLSICECAKFWNNLKLETFIIHRLHRLMVRETTLHQLAVKQSGTKPAYLMA